MRVLLASNSPRRRELLRSLVPEFDVEAFPADERFSGKTPEETVSEIARRKLVAAKEMFSDYDLVIAADTLVYMDGKYYGKPVDASDAKRMLKELSGKTHTVYSGLAVMKSGAFLYATEATDVSFKKLSEEEIDGYLNSHSVLDKAGAYAVQDGVVVKGYKGSYSNIVGLPIEKLSALTGLPSELPEAPPDIEKY